MELNGVVVVLSNSEHDVSVDVFGENVCAIYPTGIVLINGKLHQYNNNSITG